MIETGLERDCMTEQQLIYFTTIVSTGSFMQTALELNIAQSAVSKHIQALEHELGVTLFDRTSRRIRLTKAGEALHREACQVLKDMKRMRKTALDYVEGGRQKIVILALPIIGQMGFYGSISRFERKHPECRVELQEMEEPELFRRIADGVYDLAFTYMDESRMPEHVRFTPLIEDELCIAAPKDQTAPDFETIHFGDLSGRPLLGMMKHTCIDHLYKKYFREYGMTPHVIFRGRPESVIAGAAAGEGWALVTRAHANFVHVEDITLLSFQPALKVMFGIVTALEADSYSKAASNSNGISAPVSESDFNSVSNSVSNSDDLRAELIREVMAQKK